MKRIFEVYRYDPDKDAAPRMQTYEVELDGHERMLLDALLQNTSLVEATLSYCKLDDEAMRQLAAVCLQGGLANLTVRSNAT